MRDYEVVYILRPSLTEEEATAKLAKFHALVTRSENSEVVAVDHWGARQLAYQIKGEKHGHYVVAQFKAEPADLGEFERILKLDEDVLRYLVVLGEGEPTSGMSIMAESPMPAGKPASEDEGEDEEASTEGDEPGDGEERTGEFAKGATSPPEFSGGRGRRRRIDGPRIELLNYKDVGTLSRFITEQGKILPKRTTKVTAQFQRRLGRAVKRARYLALLPYIQDHDR